MTVWMSSDQHFSHENIIKYCDRPYNNIDEMNTDIIEKYCEIVKEDDIVFFLGDITIKRNTSFKPILSEVIKNMPGQKHLILGNHDLYFNKSDFTKSEFYLEDCGFLSVNRKISTSEYILTHNPADFTSEEIESGKILIHGHVHLHNNERIRGQMIDCGVDGNNFYPISIDEINQLMK